MVVVEKLAKVGGDKWCRVEIEDSDVLLSNSLLDELTVVSSRSGVGFLFDTISTFVLGVQANFGRGKFITGFLETGVCCFDVVVNTLDKSASLEDETSLELWSSVLCVVESARLVVGIFILFLCFDNSDEVTLT